MTNERLRDVLIFALGTLTELRMMGLVEVTGDVERLTATGMDEFIRLKASGFSPAAGELEAALSWFKLHGGEQSDATPEDASLSELRTKLAEAEAMIYELMDADHYDHFGTRTSDGEMAAIRKMRLLADRRKK